LVPEARIAELEAERDAYERQLTIVEDRALELKAENRRLHDALKERTDERDIWKNITLDLRDLLAQRPAPVPDPPKPDPIVNAIRARQNDRRRIGP
jgi:chromosome segregation ATPase